jgi:hypothetical protein
MLPLTFPPGLSGLLTRPETVVLIQSVTLLRMYLPVPFSQSGRSPRPGSFLMKSIGFSASMMPAMGPVPPTGPL